MQLEKSFVFQKLQCRNYVCILAFSWILSISIGLLFASSVKEAPLSLMRLAVSSPVSIVGLAVVLLVPFVLSAVAIRLSMSWFIYLIAALKGIGFGFCIYILLISFQDSAWLICSIIMFSDMCSLPLLFFFWIKQLDGTMDTLKRDVICYLTFAAIIGCIDYFLISPYVITLM